MFTFLLLAAITDVVDYGQHERTGSGREMRSLQSGPILSVLPACLPVCLPTFLPACFACVPRDREVGCG